MEFTYSGKYVSDKRRRLFSFLVLCFFAAITVFYLSLLNRQPIIGEDASAYILLGKSITSGQGYRSLWLVGVPPHTMVPFLFPLLLAAIIYFAGYNFLILKLFVTILGIFVLIFTYILVRRFIDKETALLVAVLTGICSQVIALSHSVMREIPYMLFSFIALLCATEYAREDKNSFGLSFGTILFLLLSYFTRYMGLCLVLAFLISLFLNRKNFAQKALLYKKINSVALFSFVPIGLWSLRNYLLRGARGFDYFAAYFRINDPFNPILKDFTVFDFIMRGIKGMYACIFYSIPETLVNVHFTHRTAFAFLLAFVFGYGLISSLIKERRTVDCYVVLYLICLFFWPWTQTSGFRFITPLAPFIFYYFIIGVRDLLLLLRIKSKVGNNIFALAIALLFILNLGHFSSRYARFIVKPKADNQAEVSYRAFLETCSWMKENTPSDAAVVSLVPRTLYLYSLRRSPDFLAVAVDKEELLAFIERSKPDYVLVDSISAETRRNLRPLVERRHDKFLFLYENGSNAVYTMVDGGRE